MSDGTITSPARSRERAAELQGEGAVAGGHAVFDLRIGGHPLLELLEHLAVVGQPHAVEDGLELTHDLATSHDVRTANVSRCVKSRRGGPGWPVRLDLS